MLNLLLAIIMSVSLAACGDSGTVIQYKVSEVEINDGMFYGRSPDEFGLEYNVDKNTIVFSHNDKKYKGTLTEDTSRDVYEIEWKTVPKLMDGFVVNTSENSVLLCSEEMDRASVIVLADMYDGDEVRATTVIRFRFEIK